MGLVVRVDTSTCSLFGGKIQWWWLKFSAYIKRWRWPAARLSNNIRTTVFGHRCSDITAIKRLYSSDVSTFVFVSLCVSLKCWVIALQPITGWWDSVLPVTLLKLRPLIAVTPRHRKCEMFRRRMVGLKLLWGNKQKDLDPPVLSTATRGDPVHSPSRQVKDREGESRLLLDELKLYRSWSKPDAFQNVGGTV